jgi:hypothetical protein
MVIKPAEKLTLSLVKQLVGSCQSAEAGTYFGVDFPGITRLAYPLVYWPSREQRAAGQNWVRCDVGVLAKTQCCTALVPQTASLHGKLGADLGRYRICLGQLPDPVRDQPLTSCKRPHRAELLANPVELTVTKYPSATVLTRKGRSGCTDEVKARHDAGTLVVTALWESRSEWSGGTLHAQCWIHRKDGPLPPANE